MLADELLHQAGDYGVVRIAIGEQDGSAGLTLGETGLVERGATVLAIVTLPPLPPLPCYGVGVCFALAYTAEKGRTAKGSTVNSSEPR